MDRKKVIIVNSGEQIGEQVKTSSFVLSQAKSLQDRWLVLWGLTGTASTNLGAAIRNIKSLRKTIKKEKVDLVHATYGSINSVIGMAAKGRTPFIVSFCGDDVLGTIQPGIVWRIREFVAKLFSFVAASGADHIIVKSLNIKNAVPKVFHHKISVIPNGVDINFFVPRDKTECRELLGLSLAKQYVLFNHSIGNNLLRKNKPLADAAIKLVESVFPDIQLLIAGQVDHSQMPLFINASDVVLLTSLHEGSPNIIKEAMACNVPVVSVPCGDVRERIVSQDVGFVCQYDPTEIAEKIISILRNAKRSNGREHLLNQGLSAEQVKAKIEQAYKTVTKG